MREHIDFEDQVAVVTGGASGIGEGIATEFAREGADVVVADIDAEGGEAVADAIEADHGVEAAFVHTDVSDLGACEDTVETVLDRFGRLDVLVNGAAAHAETTPFVEEDEADWAPHVEITLKGGLHMSRAALPPMIDQGSGAVINVISESYKGNDPDLTVYATAKAGLVAFTNSLAKEVGEHGVRVNAISPSTTWTPATEDWLEEYGDKVAESHPLGRLGEPVDHANAAVFLASDAADWITGQTLSVNGGYL
ncbi:MAG: SDR family NAD(P)-dependent oxidoreductase [Halobacteriales archaeon]